MAALGKSDGFDQLQDLVRDIYRTPNDRWFDLGDLATNVNRFTVRAVKAVRREQPVRVEKNLSIAFSWFVSSANRLDINLRDILWRKFPYKCATCKSCPCCCPGQASETISLGTRQKPSSIADFQQMFAEIYPPTERTLEHAAIHLVEEMGEYEEGILMYRSRHRDADLRQIEVEAADYISCWLGVFTSLGHDYGKHNTAAATLVDFYADSCHACHHAPCICSFDKVMNYNLNDKW